ncbi:fructose-bisphosphatase class II [Saccharopolyspora karakumensis]|nr:fructose-bisphosphatase class II [Saccharopolyspora karakumensis]
MSIEQVAHGLLNVTHHTAIACLPWVGGGDENAARQAATEAMRQRLGQVSGSGRIVIGGSGSDDASTLSPGELVSAGPGFRFELAVNPIEDIKACVRDAQGAMTVAAAAATGSLYDTTGRYMNKLVVGSAAAPAIDITASIEKNVVAVSAALDKLVTELSVVVLDRPRHRNLVQDLKTIGCRVRLIPDGDVVGALNVLSGEADMLAGIGGAAEGVLAACAARCLGGSMQAMLEPQSESELKQLIEHGEQPGLPLPLEHLVATDDCCFVVTAVTDTPMLRAPRRTDRNAWSTHSLLATAAQPGLLVETD